MKAVVEEREGSGGKAVGAVSFAIAAVLVLAAAFLTCSLLLVAVSLGEGAQGGFTGAGRFLYSVYGVSSFLIPVFLLACAIALLVEDAPFPVYFLLFTSLVPFFTAFGGERLIRSFSAADGTSMLSRLIFFGLLAAAILAVAAELVLLFRLAQVLERRASSRKAGRAAEPKEEARPSAADSAYIKEEKIGEKRESPRFIREEKIGEKRESPAFIREEKIGEKRAPAAFKAKEEPKGPVSAAEAAEPPASAAKPGAKGASEGTGRLLRLYAARDLPLESVGSFESVGSARNISLNISALEKKAEAADEALGAPEPCSDGTVEFAFVESAFGDSADDGAALPPAEEARQEAAPRAEEAAADAAASEAAEPGAVAAEKSLADGGEGGESGIAASAEIAYEEAFEIDAESGDALAIGEAEDEADFGLDAAGRAEAAPAPAPAQPQEMTAEDVSRLIPNVEFDPAMFDGYIAGNFSILGEEEVEALEDMGGVPRVEDIAASAAAAVDAADAGEAHVDECEASVPDAEASLVDGEAQPCAEESEQPAAALPPVPVAKPAGSLLASASRRKYHIDCDILNAYPDGEYWVVDEDTHKAAAILKDTLNEFRIQADVTGIRKGPVITMFEILPAPGVKLSKIVGLQDNIALRLAASSVRIVAPIPGKHAVGIEVPNKKRAIVSFRELIETDSLASKKMAIPVMLGKDIAGEAQIIDLAATPHLLIAGSTGSGKSVCVNSIILSILYRRTPSEVKLILIDPKVVELKLYNDIGHLLAPVITEPKKAFQALQYCLCEMERRYAVLDGMGVRNIKEYNKRIEERGIAAEPLPYIVVIIDEFADLMATTGKELESTVARLAAMSRAVGIHLVLATQRPSIDVITGLIKANIPSRIAFMVASKTDSRIIIDQVGAEKLLGKGDMLYSSVTDPFPVRIQGAFVSDEEVERVVEKVKAFGAPEYIDDEIFVDDDDDDELDSSFFGEGEDPLYDKALDIVLSAGKASASYIQRRLKIGYNRAARLVEDMEARGIVGPANGSKARDVIHVPERV